LIKRNRMEELGLRNMFYFFIWAGLSLFIILQSAKWKNKKYPPDEYNKLDRILGPIILIASPVLSYFALRFLRWILL
tara:strand:+ start:816 stop:1046 length:231 start_codon:yes stop_codon:yes gene_type:complete